MPRNSSDAVTHPHNVYAIHSKVAVADRSEDSACFAAVSVNSTFSSVDSKT